MELDFFSKAESGVVEMAMQGQYTTTALQHWTAKPEESRRKTCLGGGLKGETGRERPERCPGACNLRPVTASQEELRKLKATFKERRKGHTAKQLKAENEETVDREQWTLGLLSYCKDRFTDQNRDDQEQQRWMQTIEEWAVRDPLQEKPHTQITETFAALAEMKSAKGPGGYQATVEMWQNLPTQLKRKVICPL